MNLQLIYDLKTAERESGEAIRKAVKRQVA